MRAERPPTLDTTRWHARVARLYRYWLSIHPAEGLPGRQHFDPVDVPDLLPGIWLLDVQHKPFRLRYRLVGTAIVEAVGREVTGRWLDEAHPHLGSVAGFFDRYRHAVEQKQPEWRRGKPRIWVHRDFGEIENLLLPLAADGTTVDILIAYTVLYRPDGTTG
ncbi:MAG TPA: PAS domain-containing protein [Stellaceae bacterium]|nr:PAS domain-containing protein [Stellaceae bacterium]